ncbi:MAG: cyclic nucleotide-binding protein [Deltaproteobacteria bacterium]|nr:cyclic nucleotide-binding protein [Deltaproteobacteria bacterium]
MTKLFGKWLKIYQDEIHLFLWTATLLFLIRSSNILFNNFAETAFLKRFGVQYMPIMAAVNSVSTFFIMGVLTGFMMRMSGTRLLTNMLLICGFSVAGLRLLIPLDIHLLYPLLYVLKAQYEALLGLLFWNLANDLFNTRQSKRIFPLISAGGLLGGVLGSFGTPYLAKLISLDNLMLAYLVTTLTGALAAKRLGSLFPTAVVTDKAAGKGKDRPSLAEEFKKVIPLIKSSTLAKILILLTLLPNVAIPIMNYQFNFAVDRTFGTENGMLRFFSYFRGVQNTIALVISLFVGRIYSRFGIPVALMFHPFNYILAFMGFLFRFDIFSAMYARLSTAVLRNTINTPARAVLFGLIPSAHRAMLRPFLRGTVVRIGILAGSGLILISQPFMHPRYLSVLGCFFVVAWFASAMALKREYARILMDLITADMLDLRSLDEEDLSKILREPAVRKGLAHAFKSARGEDALWYAKRLKSVSAEGLDDMILEKLAKEDDRTVARLLPLLSPRAGKEAVRRFIEEADPDRPADIVTLAGEAREAFAGTGLDFHGIVFKKEPHPKIKAYAVAGLYPEEFSSIIRSWLVSDRLSEKQAAVIAAGGSKDKKYIAPFMEMLREDPEDRLAPELLAALNRLGAPHMNRIARPFLSHDSEQVRLAALVVFEIKDEGSARAVITRLGDTHAPVSDLAIEKLEKAEQRIAPLLVEGITLPDRRMRENIFRLFESLDIKDVEIYNFARAQMEKAYGMLAAAGAVARLPESPRRELLEDHLKQQKALLGENVLRVLVARDRSGRMRNVWRGISSPDPQRRANSVEALDDLADRSISKILTPLLEDLPPDQCLAVGKKHFKSSLEDYRADTVLVQILTDPDWLTVVLAISLIAENGPSKEQRKAIERLTESQDPRIHSMARWALRGVKSGPLSGDEKAPATAIQLGILARLKNTEVFSGLTVIELAAVASVTLERAHPEGDVVTGGDMVREEMLLIEEGEVRHWRHLPDGGSDVELGRLVAA